MDLPKGTILIWAGGSIPQGWAELSTLKSNCYLKPIRCYGDSPTYYSPSAYSGSSHTHAMPSNSGNTTVSHQHTCLNVVVNGAGGGVVRDYGYSEANAAKGGHNHSITPSIANHSESHSHTLESAVVTSSTTLPPYKTAILIVKTS